jgi:DNA invertase Pin-like site-specific DNA recombinase
MGSGDKVIGYVRVSTDKQGERGVGMEAQEQAISAECERRGWELLRIERDVLSGKTTKRPGLELALKAVRSSEASGIVVAKLDRLSRSVIDAARLLEEARADCWNIVALDFGLDFSTPQGELVANVLTAVAQWERRIIGERTREGMAIVRQQGVKIGRAASELNPEFPAEVRRANERARRRIRSLHSRGHSYSEIARRLNAEGVATTQGGARWYPATVRHVAGDFDPLAPKRRRKRVPA